MFALLVICLQRMDVRCVVTECSDLLLRISLSDGGSSNDGRGLVTGHNPGSDDACLL